ncbi:MAG: hypothetical protein WDM79_02350 [Terricaulis sp.]
MTAFALTGILAASTLLLRLPIYILPLMLAAMIGVGVRYVQTLDPAYAVTAALIFATYISATVAFIALYVARTYKNSLQRPIAYLDRKRCILQTDTPISQRMISSAR